MLYVDYNLDMDEGYLALDKELRLSSQDKPAGQVWGSLPATWQEGDLFKLSINNTGQVMFKKVTQIGAL